MNSWKKFILGAQIPDKDDPKYRVKHERAMSAGRKFADLVGITKMAGKLQSLGDAHKSACVLTMLGIVALLFVITAYRFASACHGYRESCRHTTVEKIDKALFQKHHSNH